MSLPSKPIQALLPGFLSLLNLKNLGLLPDQLEGNVQPVFDVERYMLRGQIQNLSCGLTFPIGNSPGGFGNFNGGGGVLGDTNLTVPQNEWWYVENMTGQSQQLGAGETLFMTPGYTIPGVGAFKVGVEVGGTVALQAIVNVVGYDFWIPPGGCAGLFSQSTGLAVARTVAMRLRVVRLLV